VLRALRAPAFTALLLAFAGPAGGAPFEATLTLHVFGLEPAYFPGSSQGRSAPSLVTMPSGIFSGTVTLPPPFPGAPPVSSYAVRVSGNGAGSFSGTPLAGALGVGGGAAMLAFGGATIAYVPFATPMGAAGIGVGGTGMGTFLSMAATLHFAEWATGTYTSLSGEVFQGLDSRTPAGLGQLTLVSPTRVDVVVGGTPETYSLVSTLTLDFVPEPGTPLLLATGAAVLLWQARRKARR
jgi:hypothetical protein